MWPEAQTPDDTGQTAPDVEIVKLIGQHRLAIEPGTPLEKKLASAVVEQQETHAPKLKVTGAVVARMPPGKEKEAAEGRWDFNTPELASAYADWLRARADVPFNEKQLVNIRKLSEEVLKAKKDVWDRLENLVKAGTDPLKDLAAAKADYQQAYAQSQKDEHEAMTNVANAKRTLATLERQLFQAGVDPELLTKATESTAIVMAEVPEDRIGLVEKGQACLARFYAFPRESVPGTVRSLAPTISKERRTLRVFFQLGDPKGRLKPGMFAEIGLGTNIRKTLRIPADGVLHVGQSDYVLVGTKPGEWKVAEIKTGEQYGSRIEVLEGLRPGDRVIGAGAILLKPYVVRDVQAAVDAAATASPRDGPRDASGKAEGEMQKKEGHGDTETRGHGETKTQGRGDVERGRGGGDPPLQVENCRFEISNLKSGISNLKFAICDLHPSSLISHPSSLIPHPFSFPLAAR